MKHFLQNSLRALFLSLMVLLSLPVLAEKVEIDGIWYNLESEGKQAEVTYKGSFYSEYDEYSGVVEIPASVVYNGTTYSVMSIGYMAFYNCSGLTSLTIPNSVTSIGEGAFCACSGLTSITIPNSVTDIEGYAFWDCSGLTSVHISDIAAWCNIDFGGSGSNPLYHAHHLYLNGEEVKDLVIPNSVTSIGGGTFSNCSGLTSVTIPNSVTSIGQSAFNDCSGLTSVTIPNSVTSIGSWAFSGCSGLTSVTIPNSVTSIEWYVFSGCSGLTSVTIPNSVVSIGQGAFSDCSGLASLTIPNSVTSIESRAFSGCSGLSSVTISNSVTSIEWYVFSGCSGLTSVTIPNSVVSIGQGAFSDCSGLTSVTIGSGVKTIGSESFANCPELLDFYCYAENVPSTESNAFDGSYSEYTTLNVPAASLQSYKSTEPWNGFANIVALPNQYELSVSSAGYATLCLAYSAEIPQDVEVYVAEKADGDCLKMKKVEGVLPANTGVIVKANEGTYAFIQSEDTPAEIGENLLVGSVVNTMVRADENTSYYILAAPDDNNNEVGMYRVELIDDMFECKAKKAYLPFDSSAPARIRFDFGTETGISEVKGELENVKTEIHDLSGRKVENAKKGIFIVNGKKVVK